MCALVQSGVQLRLSVNAGGPGVVRVAVVGADGKPTAGYSFAECRPLMGNFVDEPVTWKPSEGQAEVSRLPGSGGSVRLHFEMRLAELYTLEFRCA